MTDNDPFDPENANATVYRGTLTTDGQMEVNSDHIGRVACVMDLDNDPGAVINYVEVGETTETRGLIDLGKPHGTRRVLVVIPDDQPFFEL